MSEQQNYYLPITENLVGGVKFIKDNDGKELVFKSPLASSKLLPSIPPLYRDNIDEIINIIEEKVPFIGFTSSKIVGKDELDNTIYKDDNKDLIASNIKYSETKNICFPYNTIFFHRKNQWKMNCLQLDFYIYYGIIPFTNHNIPRILNIKRSSGAIQKGIISEKNGIVVRKSVSMNDNIYRIYVKMIFSDENPDETDEEKCILSRDFLLSELLTYNDIEQIDFKVPTLNDIAESNNSPSNHTYDDSIKYKVEEHFSVKMQKWKKEILIPCVQTINDSNLTIINVE